MKKHDNPSNHFNAKFDAVQAADRFVESIEDSKPLWSDVEKGLRTDNQLFEAYGQIDVWDDSVDTWHTKFEIGPDEDDEDYDDDDFDYDDDDWDYEDYDDDYDDDDEDYDDDDNDAE